MKPRVQAWCEWTCHVCGRDGCNLRCVPERVPWHLVKVARLPWYKLDVGACPGGECRCGGWQMQVPGIRGAHAWVAPERRHVQTKRPHLLPHEAALEVPGVATVRGGGADLEQAQRMVEACLLEVLSRVVSSTLLVRKGGLALRPWAPRGKTPVPADDVGWRSVPEGAESVIAWQTLAKAKRPCVVLATGDPDLASELVYSRPPADVWPKVLVIGETKT